MNDLDIKEFNNERWLKVFYHNCTNKNYFENETESKYSIDSNKYSILGNITDSYKVGNKFDFILSPIGKVFSLATKLESFG